MSTETSTTTPSTVPPESRIYFDPPVTAAKTAGGSPTQTYLKKLAGLIPAEIIAGFKTLVLIVPSIDPAEYRPVYYWIVFALGLVATPFYVIKQIGPGVVKFRHCIVYAVAFTTWAYATSGDKYLPHPYYQDGLAAFFLVVVTSALPFVPLPKKPKQERTKKNNPT